MGELIYLVAGQGVTRDMAFEPERTHYYVSEELYRKWPFLILALSDNRELNLQKGFHGVDLYTHQFMSKNRVLIEKSLKSRFGVVGRQFKPFLEGLEKWLKVDYVERATDKFINILKDNLGEKFREIAETEDNNLTAITESIWRKIQQVKIWPESRAMFSTEFVPDDLPAIMGFHQIDFILGEDRTKPIEFRLIVLEPMPINIMGRINPDGKMSYLVLDFSKRYPKLAHIIEQIAVGWLHDNLEAYSIISGKSQRASRREPVFDTSEVDSEPIQASGNTTVAEDESRTVFPQKKVLRRSTSERIRTAIENERGPGKTQFRPMKPMRLRGVSEYENACAEYRQQVNGSGNPIDPGVEAQLRAQIELYREQMYQPSDEKKETFEARVRRLPERFRLEQTLPDPISGDVYYKNTWVKPHTIPRLSKEELKSALKRFEVYGDGPMSGYINSHVIWIIYDILANEDDQKE